jgi:hypothetical protein
MSRANNYVIEVQNSARKLFDAIFELQQLRGEWTYGDYTNTLGANITLTEYPSVADLAAVVNTTAVAFDAVLAAGHGTNLTKVL